MTAVRSGEGRSSHRPGVFLRTVHKKEGIHMSCYVRIVEDRQQHLLFRKSKMCHNLALIGRNVESTVVYSVVSMSGRVPASRGRKNAERLPHLKIAFISRYNVRHLNFV